MQLLTASPREAYAVQQVTDLLVAPDLFVAYGVDLLTPTLGFVESLSSEVSAGTVHRDNLADVHGSLDLTIARELAWGSDRVRPWKALSSPSVGVTGVRFDLGVYLATSPGRDIGETPQSYTMQGYDLLTLLQLPVGDSVSFPAGANVLASVRAVLTRAGWVTPVLLDTSSNTKVLASARTWVQDSGSSVTFIGVINDLLGMIAYRGVWMDWAGNLRSGPYVLPSSRPSEMRLAVGSLTEGVVGNRGIAQDTWGIPNQMTFVRNDMPTKPVIGAGKVTLENLVTGPTSQAAVGVRRAPVTYVDAVSQTDFLAQANRIFAAATRVSEVLTITASPLPLWHADRLTFADPDLGDDREVLARSWELPLDGTTDMSIVLEVV